MLAALERVGESVERFECFLAAFVRPICEHGLKSRSERLDERLHELLAVGTEPDEPHAAVSLGDVAVDEPTSAGTVDEVADVRAVAAQKLRNLTDRRRSLDGAQELGLLSGQPDLSADLRVGIVDGHHQPHQSARDVPRPLDLPRVAHAGSVAKEVDGIMLIRDTVTELHDVVTHNEGSQSMSTITNIRAGTVTAVDDRRRARTAAVGGAIVAALTVWFVAEVVFGLDLRRPAAGVGAPAQDITAIHVVFAAAVGSLAAWALLAVLERMTSRPRRAWTVIAAFTLLVSLGGPLSGSGITTSNRLVLVLMHLIVASVVIAALARTARASR